MSGFLCRGILHGVFTKYDNTTFTASMTATATGTSKDKTKLDCTQNLQIALQKYLKDNSQIRNYTFNTDFKESYDGNLFYSAEQIRRVQEYLAENNASSQAPFSACTFGNAFTGEELFVGSGNGGPNGEPIDSSMYWRWASMSKIIGLVTMSAALEDGIISSLDEPIYHYIPEIEDITTFVSDSTRGTGNDAYGTPNYNQILTTDSNLGRSITIKMCLESSIGFGYSFLGSGSQRAALVDGFQGTKSGQNYIAWLQNIERLNGYADTIYSSYENNVATITESIVERTKYPLLCRPGTSNIYDVGITVACAALNSALIAKGIHLTAAEYANERIFKQLNMSKTWLSCGSLNPPADVLSKLTNAFFVRNDTAPSISGSNQKGAAVSYNTLYGVFDAAASGDGFKSQMYDAMIKPKISSYSTQDRYAGGFDWTGCGTLSDFCKIMKLLINNGYCPETQTQVLTKQTTEWLLTGKYSDAQKASGLALPNGGLYDLLAPSATWCYGVSKYLDNTNTLPPGYDPHTFSWGGYFGTTFTFNIKSGNYLISGTQASGASWQKTSVAFQPSSSALWAILNNNNFMF
jgi:CubicO group peptidase (beta-lactamase class C family)